MRTLWRQASRFFLAGFVFCFLAALLAPYRREPAKPRTAARIRPTGEPFDVVQAA